MRTNNNRYIDNDFLSLKDRFPWLPWPVYFSSRILHHKNICGGKRSAPGMNLGCYVQAKNGITIGDNLRMGPNEGLISANHCPEDYDKWLFAEPIIIGDNVWIGRGVVFLRGVTIGSNVIIAANSVVNIDIPFDTIASGVPCKILKDKTPYLGRNYLVH